MGEPVDHRRAALDQFGVLLELPRILRVVRRGRDKRTATYTFECEGGVRFRVESIRDLWSQAELARTIGAAVGFVPPRVGAAKWHEALTVLIVDGVEDDPDSESYADVVADWIEDYLSNSAVHGDRSKAASRSMPFYEGDKVYLKADHLRRYLIRAQAERISLHELRDVLRDLGWRRQTVVYDRADGQRASRSYYVRSADAAQHQAHPAELSQV